mgnify:CR=1 FL=1
MPGKVQGQWIHDVKVDMEQLLRVVIADVGKWWPGDAGAHVGVCLQAH